MEKLLIIGAKGNLGTQLCGVFAGENYDITAWDKEEIDITDKELIVRKVTELKPAILINAAAYNAVDKCEEGGEEFEMAKKLNGSAVGNLAEAALAADTLLVHYSSDYVFGGVSGGEELEKIKAQGGFEEDDEPKPANKYAESKFLGERELIKLSGRGLGWYLIRTSKLFGPKGASEAAKPNFFDMMLDLSAGRDGLDVVNEEMSCFTYTVDLARATRKLIEGGEGYGIYHLVNSGPATWYDGAVEMFRLAGKDIKINPVSSDKFPRPAKRPAYSVLKNTKFEPMRGWKEALKEYIN